MRLSCILLTASAARREAAMALLSILLPASPVKG